MADILGPILVLAFLIGLYAFIFSGGKGRVGRPPKGVLTRLRDPTGSPLGVAAMCGLALGSMLTLWDSSANGQSGIAIGLILALALSIPAIEHLALLACGFVIANILALINATLFVAGDGVDGLAAGYRLALMALLLACFVGASILFGRMSALRGERGLASRPGRDRHVPCPTRQPCDFRARRDRARGIPLGRCAVALALGWAASEYVLGIVALAVATLTLLEDSVAGNADSAWVGLVAAVSAVAFTALGRVLLRRV